MIDSETSAANMARATPAAHAWALALETMFEEGKPTPIGKEAVWALIDELRAESKRGGKRIGGQRIAHILNRVLDLRVAEIARVTVPPAWREDDPPPAPIPGAWLRHRFHDFGRTDPHAAAIVLLSFATGITPARLLEDGIMLAKSGGAPFESCGPIEGEHLKNTINKREKARRSRALAEANGHAAPGNPAG